MKELDDAIRVVEEAQAASQYWTARERIDDIAAALYRLREAESGLRVERPCGAYVTTLEHDIDRLAVWAVRYALGRMTYAVSDVTEAVTRNLNVLSEPTRRVIAEDIAQAEERKNLGMEMDAERWHELAAALSDSHADSA